MLLKTFDDGSEERRPILKEPRKTRPQRIDWSRKLSTGLKRGLGLIPSPSFQHLAVAYPPMKARAPVEFSDAYFLQKRLNRT